MKFWHLRLPDSCPVSVCMEEKSRGAVIFGELHWSIFPCSYCNPLYSLFPGNFESKRCYYRIRHALVLALQLQMRYMTRCMETIFPVRRGCSRHL